MKNLIAALLVAVLGTVMCHAAEPADPAAAALDKKLASIVIPEIEFREANLTDVIQFLAETAKAHDPDKKGVNILLMDKEEMVRITMSLKDVSLRSVLRYVAELSGLSMNLEDGIVVLRKAKDKK